VEDVQTQEKRPKSLVERDAEEGNWKKARKTKARERKVVSATELLQSDASVPQVIIDMRGPQTRVVTDLTTLNDAETTAQEKRLGQELLYNVNLMVDFARKDATLHRNRLREEQDRLKSMHNEENVLKTELENNRGKVDRLTKISAVLISMETKLREDASVVRVDHVHDAFMVLRKKFSDEYIMLGIDRLIPSILRRVVENNLHGWNPLEDSALIVRMFAGWKISLEHMYPAGEGVEGLSSHRGQLVLDTLLESLVIPVIQRQRWDIRAPEPFVQLVEGLQQVASDHVVWSFVDSCVLPQIQAEVARWNPILDAPIHTWLHPWLPALKAKLAAVYSDVRRKISGSLVRWKPSQSWPLDVLRPWVGVFAKRSLDGLLVNNVIPKLIKTMRDDLKIDPSNQEMDPFKNVMRWHELLPQMHCVSLWEGEFFPKWLCVLHVWLNDQPDAGEVYHWYSGWQAQFPASLLDALGGRLRLQFDKAVTMLEQFMEHGRADSPFTPQVLRSLSYHTVIKFLQELEDRTRNEIEVANAQRRHRAAEVSFKDVVEAFAEANNVPLVPKSGRAVGGQQVRYCRRVETSLIGIRRRYTASMA
jgi:tuftelin-interacting protein 11